MEGLEHLLHMLHMFEPRPAKHQNVIKENENKFLDKRS
jgi:hypothetical protein